MEFPLDFRTAMRQWWNAPPLADSERRVLSFLPFFPEPDSSRKGESLLVELSRHRVLNEFQVTRTTESITDDLVVLHGYGAGLAFFYRNFDGLTRLPGWRMHALDLLGYGRSSRPRFKIAAKSKIDAVYASENWFVDSLEEWRIKKGIDKFTLMAHSMGGYIGVAYALRHPERVKKLILVSPAGVPRDPWVIYADDAAEALVATEPGPEGVSIPPPGEGMMPPVAVIDTHTEPGPDGTPPLPRVLKELKRPMPAWLVFLWERHVSPFSFVRYTGPMGPQFVSLWTSHRFSTLPRDQASALHDYVLGLFTARGSGEYAITRLLAPGAYARIALLDRIKALQIPTLWMYGDNDWMDAAAGVKAAKIMNDNGVRSECVIVSKAGHHLYLDNPDEFNSIVVNELMHE
ncbi:Alpha/Beta hydrolase protein [Limtongia smithiae]|uniref:Alpha/Beta hydrolase protein n=1 Tax=Limtongia smithiae TaxID=1125753 RepID=UPI0034CE6251